MNDGIDNTFGSVKTLGSFAGKIAALLVGLSSWISRTSLFLAALGLTPLQAKVVIAVIFLVSFLVVLKFLKIVTKLLIFGLILWVVLGLAGLV